MIHLVQRTQWSGFDPWCYITAGVAAHSWNPSHLGGRAEGSRIQATQQILGQCGLQETLFQAKQSKAKGFHRNAPSHHSREHYCSLWGLERCEASICLERINTGERGKKDMVLTSWCPEGLGELVLPHHLPSNILPAPGNPSPSLFDYLAPSYLKQP